MGRPATVWLRKQTGWYCTTIRGEVVKLAKNRDEAQRRFHELMAAPPTPPPPPTPRLSELIDAFLAATASEREPKQQQFRVKYLARLLDHVGDRDAESLRPKDVTAWLQSHPAWGPSTRVLLRRSVKAVFNWAVREGHLDANPLAKMKLGVAGRRDRFLEVDTRRRVLAVVREAYRDFLFVLERTGCRPFSELIRLTASDVDLEAGTATIQKHKNAKKVGKPRVIYLVPEVVAVLRRLVAVSPHGPIFRNTRGNPLTESCVQSTLSRYGRRHGFDAIPYDYRHTFITEALIRGVPVEVVAELVGNSPAVIHRHYAHVAKDKDALRAAAAKAVGANLPSKE